MSREAILDAAAQIFSQKGYHAASMQDIARAVQLQKASLYHHVDSKQEILKELLDTALDLLIDSMREVISYPISPDKKLRLGMDTYLSILLEHRELASILLLEYRSLDQDLRQRHIRRRDEFECLWRDLIQEGVNIGQFECKDVAMTTRSLLGVLNWTVTWYHPDRSSSPQDIAQLNADLFLNGLLRR